MKYKIITILSLCLFLIGIIGSQLVYALSPNKLLDSALIQNTSGVIQVVQQSSRSIWVIYVDGFDGTVTLDYGDTTAYARYVLSNDDDPDDIAVGYTFISNDYHNVSGTSIDIRVTNSKYLYVSGQRGFSYTLTPIVPDPTPSISPSPSPEVTPTLSPTPIPDDNGSNIPYHFDIPLDYYFVIIIILLGGVLICQLFKK